jgi:hypothetical protein
MTTSLSREARAALVSRYAAGADAFEAALAGVADEELDAHPFDGEWSVREIAHHLCDGELNSAIRLRRLIAEDEPVLAGYDEMRFSRTLHYPERPIGPSVAAMRAARASTLSILERLTEAEWARTGTHTEQGPYSVEAWLRDYASHPHDHAEQASRVLAAIRGGGTG